MHYFYLNICIKLGYVDKSRKEETKHEILSFLKGRGMAMCKTFTSIFSIFLFIAIGLCGQTKAANMTITNLFPANNATEVCADTKLWITFATTPIVPTDSNMYLQICKVSDNSVVYQLTLHPMPSDAYGHIVQGGPWPYQITIGGLGSVNYEPFAVSSQTVEIYPSTRLAYNTAYYVKMTDGFCHDAGGNTSPAMTDNTTWQFTTKASAPAADHDYTIALDGSGDFCTLQGACDYVTDNDATRTFIKIKKGTYRELINIPSNKINITWLGEGRDTAIIAAYNRDAFNGGTSTRNLVRNSGNGFRMYNLTLQNTTLKGGHQAETIRQNATKCIAKNCKFKSYQDTLYFSGGQTYFKDTYVEGDTDFIWGSGTAYFDKCEIRSMSTSSYVTQPRTAGSANGLFFVDCNMTVAAGVTASSCYMARLMNANDYAQVVYINCTMPKTLFNSLGWFKNDQVNMGNLRLWEYKSVEPNGTLINVSGRLTPGSRQLTDAEAITWRDVSNVFSYSPAWNPKALGELPSASWQPQPADGTTDTTMLAHMTLIWAAGAEATSHVVYFGTDNPPTSGTEQTGTSFVTAKLSPGTTYYWRVDEKNSTGTTTGTVWSFTTSAALDSMSPSPDPMTWAHEPNAVSSSSITMTASTATDISGGEYYFPCPAGGGHNSGWQDSNTYTDTSLTNNTTYTYKVKARDKSINQNETADSNEKSAKTLRYDCTGTLLSDLNGNCQVDFLDFARLANAWAGNLPEVDLNGDDVLDLKDIAQFAADWLKCNRSPSSECGL